METPSPVKAFEGYCFQNSADYKRVVAMAKATKLPRVPEQMMAILGPQIGGGEGFVVVNSTKKDHIILLGVSDQNTCAIFAKGYGVDAIKASMQENYHLKLAIKDDVGLQVNEMHIPGGTKGTVSEASELGLIGFVYTKDPSFDGVTISYISPETAQKVLSRNP